MGISSVNAAAVLVAAAGAFAVGAFWYSPILFGPVWMRESGVTIERSKAAARPLMYGAAFLLTVLMALAMAAFLPGLTGFGWGALTGAVAGLGVTAPATGVLYLLERRSLRLYCIDAGYLITAYVVMGMILGTWK